MKWLNQKFDSGTVEIAKKEKRLLIEVLKPLKNKRVGLLLSGGADSIAILCALYDLKFKDVQTYGITREDYESTDFKIGKENSKKLKYAFNPVYIPTDIESIKEGVLFSMSKGLKTKAFIECFWPLSLAFKKAKEDGIDVLISGEYGDVLYCNSKAFCISGDKNDVGACNLYRETKMNNAQSKAATSYLKKLDIESIYPYTHLDFLQIYKGYNWTDLNKPVEKGARKYSWRTYFENGLKVKNSSNLQCGDTKIRDLYEKLLKSDWNRKSYKSVVGIYNSLSRGLMKEDKKKSVPRYQRVKTCKECSSCTKEMCKSVKTPKLRDYRGIRFTADGFDCALPVAIDSFSHCSFGCLYCFSDNLWGHSHNIKPIGKTNLKKLSDIFDGDGGGFGQRVRTALRYDRRNKSGFPCPVQLGGINDPMDNIERNRGWFLEFCKVIEKYQQPVRVSTKGDLFLVPEYVEAIKPVAHLFWFAFSIITSDDEIIKKVDLGAPSTTRRLEAMKVASSIGCSTSLRLRPMIPGITDATKRKPHALKELIDSAANAGAKAVSAEVMFYPGSGLIKGIQRQKFITLEKISCVPLEKVYRSFGKVSACTRPSAIWTENVMHKTKELTNQNGMVFGVSDPVWKQLSDSGCCCGILPSDPVFGNWEQENATEALLKAKEDRNFIILPKHIIPSWAYETKADEMCILGIGPEAAWRKRHATWAEKLLENYYDLKSDRGPYGYFQGALEPVKLLDGGIGFKYVGLKRKYPKNVPYWKY